MTDKILAKSSGETLSEHTIACLKSAQALIDSLPLSLNKKQSLKKDVLFAVAIHDVGKAASGFQRVLRREQEKWNGKRHEIISASYASCIKGISQAVVFAILTHHKSIPSDGITEIFGCLHEEQIPTVNIEETTIWREMDQEWKENVRLFSKEWRKICKYLGWDSLLNYKNLKSLSLNPSWLERSWSGQRKSIRFHDRYYASIIRGLTIASDHLGSAHRIPPCIPDLRGFSISNKSLRPFQERSSKIKGSAILRAPTGSGKTEAALLWAQNNQRTNARLFYILPYTASINAMHHRLTKIFGGSNVGLLHHRSTSALYGMLESNEDISSRLDKQQTAAALSDLAREIWFPIRICTPHQILRYTLRGKGWEYMLSEFPNACFIFDEIHAYDPRVVGLTLGSARLFKQWGARCFFLSATLPTFLHKLIVKTMGKLPLIEPDPKHNEDRKILNKKRHILEILDGSLTDHIELIVQAMLSCSSTLVVCNHVKTSQKLYSQLKVRLEERHIDGDIMLVHGRFNQEDRNRKEDEIINNALPKVLVATQVVEVSLDVDFEQAFFEPAPIDALIQRMGRVNRSGVRPPSKIVIFTKQINPHHLYCNCQRESHKSNCRIKLTIDELVKLKNPISERDLVEAADRVYKVGYQGDDKIKFDEGVNHPDIRKFEENVLAGAYQDWVESIIEATDGIIEILPKCLKEEYRQRIENGLWIEANSLFVPIREKSLVELRSMLDMAGDPWIANLKYTSDIGLSYE